MLFINGCGAKFGGGVSRCRPQSCTTEPRRRRRTVAQHDLSHGHSAVKMETAPLSLGFWVGPHQGGGGAAIISGSPTQVTHTNQEGRSSDDRTVVYIQKR